MKKPSRKKTTKKSLYDHFKHVCNGRIFGHAYVYLSAVILLSSTAYWAYLSAKTHAGNADHLVNPYMFDSVQTFKGSLFPSQHTYFLKWPLFMLVFLFGETDNTYMFITVGLALVTVGLFAVFLHKIEKRQLPYGTLLLALASVMMLIPAQPYPGALLPMNMGMIANRNIEYIIFVSSLYTILRAEKLRDRRFWYGLLGLSILAVSDKLFVVLALGSAGVGIVVLVGVRRKEMLQFAYRYLGASIAALGISAIAIKLLASLHITGVSQSTTGPYMFVSSVGQAAKGTVYFLLNTLSNFGANPAFSANFLRQFPSESLHNLFSSAGIGLIVNLSILCCALFAAYITMVHFVKKHHHIDGYYLLSLLLMTASATAIGSYIFTNHYYPVDGRYLSILFFTLFVVLTLQLRRHHYQHHYYVMAGSVLAVSILMSSSFASKLNQRELSAGSNITARNKHIVEALSSHRVNTLVGDYWRVFPIRQLSHHTVGVTPLSGCSSLRDVLSSKEWQPALDHVSFAYLLSDDKAQTDYPHCTVDDAIKAYGHPNASFIIEGTPEKPIEQLLFYDYGAFKSEPRKDSSAITPILLESLNYAQCESGNTVMNIVAHEDDDLLFINPDTYASIKAGNCVRSVFVTAGDSGSTEKYWSSREQGSMAAYATMLGEDVIWVQRIVKLPTGQFVYIFNPKNNHKISLIFLRLPDGNLRGDGFISRSRQSLSKLYTGPLQSIDSIYGGSTFSRQDLINTLTALMKTYHSTEIRTQSTFQVRRMPDDHSDHMAVSRFVKAAHDEYITYEPTSIIKYYLGYPVRSMPENVSAEYLDMKKKAFFSYSLHDGAVCHSNDDCALSSGSTYHMYLRRMYSNGY